MDIAYSNIFTDISPDANDTKESNKEIGLQKTKMFLHSKGKCQHNKKISHGMGKHIHQYIWQRINIQNLQWTYKTQDQKNNKLL